MKAWISLLILVLLTLSSITQEKILSPIEEIIGNTWFDIQTTRSMQNRIFYFDDGTIGAVWNLAFDYSTWDDLGVGYNYFDGVNWGEWPTQIITSGISKNPSYTKFGQNGEIVVSEGENGLFINYRMTKGQGNWEEVIFPGPAGFEKLYSPQIVTTGINNEVIHLLTLRKDTSIQFEDYYQDNVRQVLYNRSTDYGSTWEILHHEFDFNEDYFGFSELSLVWAEPKNNTMAFVVGDYYTDLILMKSTDGGDSWQKTIVWEHPYPYFEHNVMLVDTFWANSGSQSLALDFDATVHLTFAVTSIISDSLNWTGNFDVWADGIVYWNEDRPTFSNDPNALCAYADCIYSELVEDYSLIGWTQDINNNGTLDFLFSSFYWTIYPSLGISTMPTINVLYNNQINIVWSSVTETYDNGTINYHHLWRRSSFNGGEYWGLFNDLTSDLIHIFDECVFPVFATFQEDEYLHLIYQLDNEPGLNIENGGPPFQSENFITHMKIWYENPYYLFLLFNADQTTIHEGDTVSFTNNSYGSPGTIIYQWYFEGGTPDTSTATHPSVTYYNEGIYDVTLIGSNDLYTDTIVKEDYITVLPETYIKTITESESIKIYPNPTKGRISINFNIDEDIQITIFNLHGKIVINKIFKQTEGSLEIDLSENPEGIYFLKIESKNKYFSEKVVLKK